MVACHKYCLGFYSVPGPMAGTRIAAMNITELPRDEKERKEPKEIQGAKRNPIWLEHRVQEGWQEMGL